MQQTKKRSFWTFAFSLLFVFASIFAFSACGNPIKQVSADISSGVKTSYAFDEEFSAEGLKAVLKYNNNETKEVALADFAEEKITIDSSAFNRTQPGQYAIYVIYNNSATIRGSYSVTVAEPNMVGMEVNSSEVITKYKVGSQVSSVNLAKLKVSKVFLESNAPEITINEKSKGSNGEYLSENDAGYVDGYEVSSDNEFSTASVAAFIYTVKYGDYTQTFEVNIVQAATAIEEDVTKTTFAKTYAYGTDISKFFGNLAIKATRVGGSSDNIPYRQGFTEDESFSIDYSDYDATTSGTYDIIIKYNNALEDSPITITIQVTVEVAKPTELNVDRSSIPEAVEQGEDQDWGWNDLVVTLSYEDGRTPETLSAGEFTLDLGGYDLALLGVYTITISYEGVASKTFDVEVVKSASESLWYDIDADHRVIFMGRTYNFSSQIYTNLKIYTGDSASGELLYNFPNGATLPALAIGDYFFTYDWGSQSCEKHYKVVDYVKSLDYGTDYVVNQSTLSKLGTDDATYISGKVDCFAVSDTNIYTYEVGQSNPYFFDIKTRILGKSSATPNNDVVDYVFSKLDDKEWVKIEEGIEVDEGYRFTFANSLIGSTIKCEVSLKYQNRTDRSSGSYETQPNKTLTYIFNLKDGYNVFDNQDMKSVFGNLSVTSIYIQRNIKVALSDEQYNPDGSIRNIFAGAELTAGCIDFDGSGNVIANRSGNAYVRAGYGISDNKLEINGNYFNIDGSGLDLVTLTGIWPNQPDSFLNTNGTSEGRAINCQTAMFSISMVAQDNDAHRATYLNKNDLTKEEMEQDINNKVTFNNLTIIGNTRAPTGDATNEEQIKVAIANSGGHIGIRAYDADIETNNVNIRFTVIGLFSVSIPTDIKATDTEITESWANNLYVYQGGKVELVNCDFSYAGGASVWIEDHDARSNDIFNPSFKMDDKTKIENWISGTEAWFVVHNMSLLATNVKAQLEQGINAALDKTIITTKTNPTTGQQFELFNFAIVFATFPSDIDMGNENGEDWLTTTHRVSFDINGVKVNRTSAEVREPAKMAMPIGIVEKITELCSIKAGEIKTLNAVLSAIASQINEAGGDVDVDVDGVSTALSDPNNGLHQTCVAALTTIAQGYTAVESLLGGLIEANVNDALVTGINTALSGYSISTTKQGIIDILRKVIKETELGDPEKAIYGAVVTGFVSTFVTEAIANTVKLRLGGDEIFTLKYIQEQMIGALTDPSTGPDDLYHTLILAVMQAKQSILEAALKGYGMTVLMAEGQNYIEINQKIGDYWHLALITQFYDR